MGSYDNSGGNYDWSAYYAQTGGSSSQYPQHQEYLYEDVNNPQGVPAQGDPAQGGFAQGGTYPFAGQVYTSPEYSSEYQHYYAPTQGHSDPNAGT
jgi:predicted class III extradiol MEMO1 family dioxygenase